VIRGGGLASFLAVLLALGAGSATVSASDFKFERDTLSFTNSTVFEYRAGYAQAGPKTTEGEKKKRYTRRCFVMSRSVLQFYKFARFDPAAPALNDKELAHRVRSVTRIHPWNPPLPPGKRIAFPGYRDLRHLSQARARLLQENLGLGWPVYARIGNFRMFFLADDKEYQSKMHSILNATMADGGFFVAYLSDYPHFRINHSVLVYGRRRSQPGSDVEHYIVYDPNHPDGPRELKWSNSLHVFNFQKDQEFPGGFTKVYQVYGKPFQ
jgi:hypothetical protein